VLNVIIKLNMENIQKYNPLNSFKKLLEIGDNTTKITILFAISKGYKFENREQLKAFIKRNKRNASELKDYPIQRIIETLNYLKENADFKYTISSVGKYIDEDLTNLNKNKIVKI